MDRGWFAEPAYNAKIFRPVDQLSESKEEWAVSLTESVDQLPDAKFAGDVLQRYRYTKQDLMTQISVLEYGQDKSLDADAFESMVDATESRIKWRFDRKASTSRKVSTAFQKSMSTFSSFLESFSAIVQIAQAADQQYGGLAYGTLSLLLSVFVHKTQREQALDDGFEELSLAFPRLSILRGLDRNTTPESRRSFQQLEGLIACTFELVLKFAREATQYYKSRSQRYKQAFLPGDRNNKTLAEIRKTLNEIHHEIDILQLAKIQSLEQRMDAMSLQLGETHKSVMSANRRLDRARSSADITHLAHLRQILDVHERSKHTDLDQYRSMLSEAFSASSVQSRHYHPKAISMNLLKSDGEFGRWWESTSSGLLFAGGSNMEDAATKGTLNWLSLGAVLAVEELRNQRKNVAFFLAQTNWTVTRRTRCPTRKIMASLLYQIAQMHDDLLRSEVDTLQAAVQSTAWKKGTVDQFMENMHDILIQILSCFPQDEEIFVVIDRLDQCAWDDDDEEEMRLAVGWLLCVAAEASCHLKILLTVDSAASRRLERTQSTLPKKEKKALLLKAEWCQEVEEGRRRSL